MIEQHPHANGDHDPYSECYRAHRSKISLASVFLYVAVQRVQQMGGVDVFTLDDQKGIFFWKSSVTCDEDGANGRTALPCYAPPGWGQTLDWPTGATRESVGPDRIKTGGCSDAVLPREKFSGRTRNGTLAASTYRSGSSKSLETSCSDVVGRTHLLPGSSAPCT